MPWLIESDFNEVLGASEKYGRGDCINNTRVSAFWNCINSCSVIDLDFKESKFTWTNKKYRNRKSLILERLDRCLANEAWLHFFPETTITYLPKIYSSHCPLLVNIHNQPPRPRLNKPFRVSLCGVPIWISSRLSWTLLAQTSLSLKPSLILDLRLELGIGSFG